MADLVALSRAGRHAASDHLETAALCGVPTIGCRRVGGGLAGQVFVSNVLEGAWLAAEQSPDAVVFDSSGTAIPPVEVDRRVLVVGPGHDLDAHFNLYRRLISDIVVSVGAELEGAFSATLRLRPLEPLEGRVAVFTAGGVDVGGLGTEVVHVSHNLGNRAALAAELARVDADTYLVELKGAAIDVVAEHALARGRRVVLAANDVVAPELDEAHSWPRSRRAMTVARLRLAPVGETMFPPAYGFQYEWPLNGLVPSPVPPPHAHTPSEDDV